MRTLYVGGLSPSTDSDALRGHFARFGELCAARVVVRSSGDSRGFGYVVFKTADSAERARRELNGRPFGDAVLRVAAAW